MDTAIKPKVSIQMCTYNRAHFIKEAIESVLKQSFEDWELLILDDASTDNTEGIVSPFLSDSRVKYLKNETNLGITKNRNKSLRLSRGKYIAVLDSDDYWKDPKKLEKQVDFLDNNQNYALIGTNMEIVDANGIRIKNVSYPQDDRSIRLTMLIRNPFSHSSVLYGKEEIIKIGAYDESLPIWEDYDLWLRVGGKYKFANLDMIGVSYRTHSSQSDSGKRISALNTQRALIERYKTIYKNHALARLVHFLRMIRVRFS